ncbi:hypothetical protein [Pontibacter kalidii]|uniref:hypothetical protein n=1 Tax=Pontibacter kalidii TaxID=2592049 RepID=UPI00224F5402|nr:hypothetical protein [Pontibacter kalidii]
MKTSDILKPALALAFFAVVGFGCDNRAERIEEEDTTGTAEAVVGGDEGAANLTEPRPAPIGDTAVTGEQADQFGNPEPNVDSAARELQRLDEQKQRGTTTN